MTDARVGNEGRKAGAIIPLLAASLMVLAGPPARAAYPGNDGSVAFVGQFMRGTPDDIPRIFRTVRHGTAFGELTSGGTALDPTYSPDGMRFAFQVATGVRVADADGSNAEEVTACCDASSPTWSPDGSRLAYEEGGEIYIQAADGSGSPRRLTFNEWSDGDPAWSPNGRHMVFSSYRDGNIDLYVMEIGSSRERRLTFDHRVDGEPAWSPDGNVIAFQRADAEIHIWVTSLDGSGERLLTDDGRFNTSPAWSPSGMEVAFASNRGGGTDIWAMDAAGDNLRNITGPITRPGARETEPTWQPLCTHRGTLGSDLIVGTSATDLICGMGGDDLIRGLGGDDVVFGGQGRDDISGGDGNDVVVGGPGSDRISGGPGADLVSSSDGVEGNDHAIGGAGVDICEVDPEDVQSGCR